MNRPWSVGMLLLSFLLCANPALAKNPYEKSFDLNVLGKSIGQVIVSFEDRIKPGSFTFGVSTSLSSLLSSGFPPGVSPYPLPGVGLPVYITISTTAAFRGPAAVSVLLEIMDYNPMLPLRLFVADAATGSEFKDITAYQGPGSMYTRGYRDGFSVFVIAWDARPTPAVINSKFNEISNYLSTYRNVISPGRYQDLRYRLDTAIQAYRQKGYQQSIDRLEYFVDSVESAITLKEMPATFNDPMNPYPNVAGALIMQAETTIFSIGLLK